MMRRMAGLPDMAGLAGMGDNGDDMPSLPYSEARRLARRGRNLRRTEEEDTLGKV